MRREYDSRCLEDIESVAENSLIGEKMGSGLGRLLIKG